MLFKEQVTIAKRSQTSRTPIKLRRFTFTEDGAKLVINDMTNISQPLPTEYKFQFQPPAAKSYPNFTVDEIKRSSNDGDLVTFPGKLLHRGDSTLVGTKKPQSGKHYFWRYHRNNNCQSVGRIHSSGTGTKSVPSRSPASQNLEWSKEVELDPSFSFHRSFSPNSAERNPPHAWDARWRREYNYSSDWCFHQQFALRGNLFPLRKLWSTHGPRDRCEIHTVPKVWSAHEDGKVSKATLCKDGCSVWRRKSSANCL